MSSINIKDIETTTDIAIDLYNEDIITDWTISNRDTDNEDVRIIREDGETMSIKLHEDAEEGVELDVTWAILDIDEEADAEYIVSEDGADLPEAINQIIAWAQA
ncbi:hypothetical protein I6I10_07480 [Corynebacterium glucuronolyticum]|uniref:Uncharacterized protein n=1 Tax=Corynebacterium glucuronolyticum TaxID=39791 RepID=A0A7T4ECX0_9CORY|nr:hypothetical protein [Corynebacterium glucuronolyticum]QQB45322.1 hypothetical protein I6I10_07180 [Corynebacterium glucuronolyticum]QQB45377.1 hypothetical protein I6I10_07480 [Corynebacterium glucuronolyticum]WKD64006.1 hypothetical protein CGLUCO_08805 [Corynebacterium glucuronolyticum DSM 44120]SMB83357.1 hypothetical protein SAMN05660745_02641 [Corynebacterium glucuronolyticum]